MRTLLVIAGLAAASGGCSYNAETVPLQGERTDLQALAGEWVGEYAGADSRRIGSVTFVISARGDSAAGDVLMEAAVAGERLQHIDPARDHLDHARTTELLAIRFIAVAGGQVRGEMEPYMAPDCRCTVRTTFTGRVEGDQARGTFVTVGTGIAAQRGTWSVRRLQRPR
jgi:hypothetical protein